MRQTLRLFASIFLVACLCGCGINNIPRKQAAAEAAWSQVQNEYQRRADLVPNLVATVKGYATHEEETLKAVTEARSRVGQMQLGADALTNPAAMETFARNQSELGSALQRLMVVVEKYPDLKANEGFLQLQSQLEGTENRIAVARRDFILSVQSYNTEIVTIPGRWWKAFLYSDAQKMDGFKAEESAQHGAPKVQF